MFINEYWKDYELLDATNGERLERWGKYILIRPDPQVIWSSPRRHPLWNNPHGVYRRAKSGGGQWVVSKMPADWNIQYRDLTFKLRPMGFKHTGLFPEQAVNWDWFSGIIRSAREKNPVYQPKVLNLFAYTGGATVAAAKAGASVCHVDAAKGMVLYAKENAEKCGLKEAPIRYITDDCRKFVEREIRRGNHYDAIIMDPPSYGRGTNGEVWKLEDAIDDFLALVEQLLSPNPLFFLLNSYTTGLSASTMKYMVSYRIMSKHPGHIEADELGLPVKQTGLFLSCGSSVRLEFN